jgi:putative ABC transport system permease protein
VRILVRASRRYLMRHPWQTGLSVLGVALGVAVVVSVDLANASARRAFHLSTEAVTGRTTHQIVGGPGGLDEDLYRRLVVEAGIHPAAPVIEGWVETLDPAGSSLSLRVLGVDPFSERPFRPYLRTIGRDRGIDVGAFLTRPGAAVLSHSTAARLGVGLGDTVPLADGRRVSIVGWLEPGRDSAPEALDGLLVTDLSTAQELLGQLGNLTRIDLRVPDGPKGAALLAHVRELLAPGVRVLPAAARSRATEEMTRAFRLNLQALALLALLCGVFLIYNTMTFSVVQRRALLGTYRALGVTRRQVLAVILGEALAVGLAGTALGLVAGVLLGRGLVGRVTTTINDLYFSLEVRHLALDPASLAKGIALGLGATVLAALAPAREAVTAPPRAAQLRSGLEAQARRGVLRAALTGLALAAAGTALLLALPGLIPSFGGLFAVLLGLALLTPAATVGLMRGATPAMGRLLGLLGRMAARGVVASLSRTAVALAALMIAVSVTVGMGILIDSFRGTVESWLESTLRADLYIAPADPGPHFDSAPLDPELPGRISRLEGVAGVTSVRRLELESAEAKKIEITRLLVFDLDERGHAGFELTRGDPERVWPAFETGGAAVVSEVYAYRQGVGPGDELTLPTDRGPRRFPIVGVWVDYASDHGLVMLSRATYERYWDDRALSAISAYLAPGTDPGPVADRIRRLGALTVRSNRALKRRSLEIFDRTFLITDVLRLLAGLVAFLGVLSALMALQLERARELGVLRANGLTPGQVWHLITAQTGLMGLVAGLLSLPVGLVMAVVMVYVINRRSFGWTLSMEVPPAVLAEAVRLVVVAAVLAGLYPAWKMARTSPAVALREE